jgi:hypothetical protein
MGCVGASSGQTTARPRARPEAGTRDGRPRPPPAPPTNSVMTAPVSVAHRLEGNSRSGLTTTVLRQLSTPGRRLLPALARRAVAPSSSSSPPAATVIARRPLSHHTAASTSARRSGPMLSNIASSSRQASRPPGRTYANSSTSTATAGVDRSSMGSSRPQFVNGRILVQGLSLCVLRDSATLPVVSS